MKATLEQVTADALSLTSKERAALTRTLIESFDEGLAEAEPVWRDKVNRRVEEIQSGRVKGVSAEEVLTKLRTKYG